MQQPLEAVPLHDAVPQANGVVQQPAGAIAQVAVQPAPPVTIYVASTLGHDLRQGEILSGVLQLDVNSDTDQYDTVVQPLAIVASQDCDLLWDYKERAAGRPGLSAILMLQCGDAEPAREAAGLTSVPWKRVRQNESDRFHFLQAVEANADAAGAGLPDMLVDFRRIFTVSPAELYRQLAKPGGAQRRAVLVPPYREHLQNRVAFYLSRVGLPEPHSPAD
ncbi:MAG: hypothetical protein ABL879_14065 [Devosia sp.]